MDKPTRIIITGEGGQGVQTIGKILAKAAFIHGKQATYLPNYGVEQRGGVSIAFVQICECYEDHDSCSCEIGFPKFLKADLLVNFCERAIERTKVYTKRETLYVYDSILIDDNVLNFIKCPKIAIPATDYARKNLEAKVFNMIMLGAIIGYTDILDIKDVEKAFLEEFAPKIKKRPEIKHLNLKALKVGYDLMKNIETARLKSQTTSIK